MFYSIGTSTEMKMNKNKYVVQHRDFPCNEKEQRIIGSVQHRPCNEKELRKNVLWHRGFLCKEKEPI